MSDFDSDHELSSQARDIEEWEEEDTERMEEDEENDEGDDEEEDDDTKIKQRLVIGLDYGTTYTGIIFFS